VGVRSLAKAFPPPPPHPHFTFLACLYPADTAIIRIPELDFEIPSDTQKGSLSTVEGVISRAVAELGALQEEEEGGL